MSQALVPAIEDRLPAMAAEIRALIPEAEIRLFGSRASGGAAPDSDIDLLITVPDAWLATHNRYRTLSGLRRRLAMADVSLDLLLYSRSEVEARRDWKSHVIGRAYREGLLLDGAL